MLYGLCLLIGAALCGTLVYAVFRAKTDKIIADLRDRLAVSEEKNFRIPKLEAAIADHTTRIDDLQRQVESLQADIAHKVDELQELNHQLLDERTAAKDKLSMINDAQGRLSRAMTELSQTALHCDNDEFIESLKMSFARFQEGLLADIARWQGIEPVKNAVSGEISPTSRQPQLLDTSYDLELEQMIEQELSAYDVEGDTREIALASLDETPPASQIPVKTTEQEVQDLEKQLDVEISLELGIDEPEKAPAAQKRPQPNQRDLIATIDEAAAIELAVDDEDEEDTPGGIQLSPQVRHISAIPGDESEPIRLADPGSGGNGAKKKLNFQSDTTQPKKEAG
jgi:hypothetical protein